MYVTAVPIEDLLDENDLFGTVDPTEDVQPQAVVEEDHDPEDRVPISILGKSPQKSIEKGTGEAS